MLRRSIRVRWIALGAVLVAAALAFAVAFLAGSLVIHAELRELLPTRDRLDVIDALGLALLIGAAAALLPLLLFGSWLGGAAGGALVALRSALQRLARGESGAVPPSRVAELAALGAAAGRAVDELRRRTTELAAERDELVLLVEAAGEGIVQLDAEGRVRRVNGTAAELLGLPHEAVGRPVGSLVRHHELREALERAARQGRLDPCEITLEDRRLLVAAHPIAGAGAANGSAARDLGAVVVLVDLTELRRLEGVRRDFVANASHELKTPLTSIRGYAETLLQGDVPEDMQRLFLETIGENANRLQGIVDDLLDLTRLESGGWRPEPDVVDPAEVAAEAWAAFAERAGRAGVAFEIHARPGALVRADASALRQIFTNLFDNALRYTPAGGRIDVTIRPDSIEVRDTGSGIPRDALPRIFERFYRVDPARSREAGGTGLGLSIVRHLAEQMGGGVEAASEIGKGTTIRLRLPSASPAALPADPSAG